MTSAEASRRVRHSVILFWIRTLRLAIRYSILADNVSTLNLGGGYEPWDLFADKFEYTTLPVDINRVLGISSLFIVLAHLSPKYCISVAANVSAGVKRWCSFYAQKSFNDAPAQLHVFFRCKLINKTEILADNPDGVKVDNMQCVDIDVFKIVRPLRHRRICGT